MLLDNTSKIIELKNGIMKKLFLVLVIGFSFAACKSKSDLHDASNKNLLLLSDSANMNNDYLSDSAKRAIALKYNSTNGTSANSSAKTSTSSGNASSSNASTTTTTQKKGWGKAAQGAVIGGVGGAVAGTVIGHNAKAAVIGAVVGGTGGYIIGRSKDKKDGRVKQ
jgi:hypothetical protein